MRFGICFFVKGGFVVVGGGFLGGLTCEIGGNEGD